MMIEHIPQRKPKAALSTVPKPSPMPKTPDHFVHQATASGGSSLDTKTQREMGSRFGHDFSKVRIHTDTRASESAQALGANAYAFGSDIVFGSGRYAPGSADGDRLLAHELTHVVQQAQYGRGDPSRTSRRVEGSENEAEELAGQVLDGQAVHVRCAPTAGVQCYQAPDQEWNAKHDDDEMVSRVRRAEVIPGFGNLISGALGAGGLVTAGYDAITGNSKEAKSDLAAAEDFGLNAIPWFGNARAAKQAKEDGETVRRDERGVPPQYNPNSRDRWENHGQDNFNNSVGSVGKAIGSVWDDFF